MPVLGADLLQVVIWVTPAGTLDEGGLVQPPYLNFDAALLGPPASHEMQVGVPSSSAWAEAHSSEVSWIAAQARCTWHFNDQGSATQVWTVTGQ